ncbi:MAG: hypothetical protein ABIH08_03525 [Candidatus Omnitrophota bacterium]
MQRFGPINSDVGWRRLNVLFTRAKKRMHVFSSMSASDIVVTETSKKGILSLKEFLSYAQSGELIDTPTIGDRLPDSDFEIAVMNFLQQAGFKCVPQVGVVGFFIDIAVRDPGKPGRFLMGIECDGATYHSSKSVRDRDRLRQEVLERLGWKMRRIWSTDWFKDARSQLKPIIDELHKSKTMVVEPMIEKLVVAPKIKGETVFTSGWNQDESLREALGKFNEKIIRKKYPDVQPVEQLLSNDMIDAFIRYKPETIQDFQERIPSYLRLNISPDDAEFLKQVLQLVRDFNTSSVVDNITGDEVHRKKEQLLISNFADDPGNVTCDRCNIFSSIAKFKDDVFVGASACLCLKINPRLPIKANINDISDSGIELNLDGHPFYGYKLLHNGYAFKHREEK